MGANEFAMNRKRTYGLTSDRMMMITTTTTVVVESAKMIGSFITAVVLIKRTKEQRHLV
jgi:hypothetical protein